MDMATSSAAITRSESIHGHPRRWYVAHNGSGHDERAKEILERAKFEFYYPVVAETKVMPRKKLSQKQRRSLIPVIKKIFRPLFPRYFFVRFDLCDGQWRDLFDLAGLRGFLASADRIEHLPASIADGVIDKLRAKEINGAIPEESDVLEFAYAVGEQVRIKEGMFFGHHAIVDNVPGGKLRDLDESARVKLLVSLFGRQSVVEMSIFDIEKII